MSTIGIHVKFVGTFDDAIAKVTAALATEGFGILTDIDVQATFKKKLDVDFRRYRILGACNPGFAHRALSSRLDVGLLLPCNVAVYESDDGTVELSAIDPLDTLAKNDASLAALAADVQDRLRRALEAAAR